LLIFSTQYVRRFLDIGVIPLHLLEWAILIVTLYIALDPILMSGDGSGAHLEPRAR